MKGQYKMPRIAKDRSFWMGILGVVVGCIVMQGLFAPPWARGQASAAEGGTKSLTASSGGVTNGGAGGSGMAARLIPFQAYLTDSNGRPVEGQHGLTFRIYDDPTQGAPLWSETHGNVPVSKGMVNVLLGSMTSFGSLTFDAGRYVGVSVDGALEMVPRQQVIPAIHAADASRLGGSPGGFRASSIEIVPIGGVITYFGNPADLPENWRICDGSVVNDSTSALNGKALPDLRNKFVRSEGNSTRDLLASGANSGGSDSVDARHAHGIWDGGGHTHGGTLGAGGHNHSIEAFGGHQHETPILSKGVLAIDARAPWGVGENEPESVYSATLSDRGYHSGLKYALTNDGGSHTHPSVSVDDHTHPISNDANHNHGGTATGGNSAQENRPAYVALHYVIRIK